jgi:hypothetical protein
VGATLALATVATSHSAGPALPVTHTNGAVAYVTGGIGEGEAKAIDAAAKHYPLALEFVRKATPRDQYLAGVKVRIQDANQNIVLDVTSDGPFLLAKLPDGPYTVSAQHGGSVEQRHVNVAGDERRRLVFEWP